MLDTLTLTSTSLKEWTAERKPIAIQKVLENISPSDGRPGAVLASPSRETPNYYYHWVRDAARTMRTLVALESLDINEAFLDSVIKRYVDFSKINQQTPTRSNSLGEPKFFVDGTAFFGDWGRPQNDGPAERAIALIRWANMLLKEGERKYVVEKLYDSKEPSQSVIKADLDFVGHHWQDGCFDLWEEVDGTHFYTRTQQRTALREGAELARILNDDGAAKFFDEQAQKIEDDMERFWNKDQNHIMTTIDWKGGANYKNSNLDIAIILGSCYGYSKDFPFYAPNHDRVLATAFAIHNTFDDLYPINNQKEFDDQPMGPAIGRYSEDIYNPNGGKANPWFLCTLAMSTLCYSASTIFEKEKSVKINEQNIGFITLAIDTLDSPFKVKVGDTLKTAQIKKLVEGLGLLGDMYLRRVQCHGAEDGSLSEQFDLNTGYMLSARDLTWSYIALIIAIDLRDKCPINDD